MSNIRHQKPAWRTLRAAAVLPLATAIVAPYRAGAGEYCVRCEGPVASYTCATGGASGAGALGAQASAEKLHCIAELAARGGHKSCSVSRDQSSPCEGLRVVLGGDPAVPGSATSVAPAATMPPPAPKNSGGNETVVPKRPAAATADQGANGRPMEVVVKPAAPAPAPANPNMLEKAGQSIGEAAQKSWNCVASLFKSC